MRQQPPGLLLAAAAEAVEAALVCAASVLAGVDTVAGRSYQQASGIALTVIGLATAAGLGFVAAGLVRGRRWTRTPALLTQLFVGIVGIYLLQGGRLDWGLPAVLMALAGFAGLLQPASMRALVGPRDRETAGGQESAAARQPGPPRRQPAQRKR